MLEYKELEVEEGRKYNGYVNKDNGLFEGVGMFNYPDGTTILGEFFANKPHGCVQVCF
jgi:hypothetical protein